jgi:hypothetical protein
VSSYRPALTLREQADGVRLHLGSVAHGDGPSLQKAADDLVQRVLVIAKALRTGGISVSTEVAHDAALLNFLWELDELAAAGGDVRPRIIGA